MAEMSKLRAVLNHIRNNFNQAVKRLHLDGLEVQKATPSSNVDEIKIHIRKMAEKGWP